MKLCTVCGTDVGNDFYQDVPQRHRRCHAACVRLNRLARHDYYLAYDRARAMRPDRVERRKEYAATELGREAHGRALRKAASLRPERHSARITFNNAVRDGKVPRQPCEVCGDKKAQGHHPDYAKPLSVRWLCTKHHADVHRGRLILAESPIA